MEDSPNRKASTTAPSCLVLYIADPDFLHTPPPQRSELRDQHCKRVRDLSDHLRANIGINCMLDQYRITPDPPENWQRWLEEEIEQRDSVLLVLTPFFTDIYLGRTLSDEQQDDLELNDDSYRTFLLISNAKRLIDDRKLSDRYRSIGETVGSQPRRNFRVYPVLFDRYDREVFPPGYQQGPFFRLGDDLKRRESDCDGIRRLEACLAEFNLHKPPILPILPKTSIPQPTITRLTKEILNSQFNDVQMYNLAKYTGASWQVLGLALQLRSSDLTAVEHDRQSAHDRAREVLTIWRERTGHVKVKQLLEKIRHEPDLRDTLWSFVDYLQRNVSQTKRKRSTF